MSQLERVLPLLMQAQHLGLETLRDGTRLIGRVPHIAPEAWLHIVFRPLAEAEVRSLETDLNGRLDRTFRDLLLEANGLSLFSDSISVFGLRTSYARDASHLHEPYSLITPNREERPADASAEALIIGCYRWDGSLLYVNADGRIHRCTRDSTVSLHQWSSLEDLLVSEVSRLSKMCDAQGRIDPNTPTVP